ncbi:hypothetical protein BJ165DRAFT_1343369 [Panaeolus papilionaceus]|nr:hypothetical protein BJ165DRAFT_1343369 [Panaeolus papilionaceus]
MDTKLQLHASLGLDSKITKHPEFYFQDGSVVLIVEKVAFRVHQSVLSRHSEVFKGMWDMPQPPEAESYDGCPAVVLLDSVRDFEDVMKVLYDSFYFDKLKPDSGLSNLITFISGILRISTKYNMAQLRNKCINIIQEKFPSTLAGCDAVLSKHTQYIPSEIVRIIPLARETNVPKVLPWAFYLCCHIEVEELMVNTALSWSDKALCLAGKEHLWKVQKTISHSFLFEFKQVPGCPSGCARVVPQISWQDCETLRKSPHPLEEYPDWNSTRVCPKCRDHIKAQHRDGREKVWQMLPGFFGLGSWDDICKDQNC